MELVNQTLHPFWDNNFTLGHAKSPFRLRRNADLKKAQHCRVKTSRGILKDHAPGSSPITKTWEHTVVYAIPYGLTSSQSASCGNDRVHRAGWSECDNSLRRNALLN